MKINSKIEPRDEKDIVDVCAGEVVEIDGNLFMVTDGSNGGVECVRLVDGHVVKYDGYFKRVFIQSGEFVKTN